MDAFFLAAEDLAYLSDVVTQWIAYGIGLGAIAYMVGVGVRLIFMFLRY